MSALQADEISEQVYTDKLNYQRNKLELLTKKRVIDEKRSYSSTNISATTYSYEAYSQTYGNIATSSLAQAEVKEITDWYIYKGAVRELSDLEFLSLVNERMEYNRIKIIDDQKAALRMYGNLSIGLGVLTMLGGAGLSAGQTVISGGALLTAGGFFLSAFNLAPHHYILPDYAQEKIDAYNINLKKKLNLPIDYN